MGFLSNLAAKNPQIILYIPKLYEAGESYFIREYIDADPVIDVGMEFNKAKPRLDKLAYHLAGIDRIEPYGKVKFVGHFDYHNIRKNFPKWNEQSLKSGYISQAQVNQINKTLDELQVYLKPRFAHGDLLPHSHTFYLPNDL